MLVGPIPRARDGVQCSWSRQADTDEMGKRRQDGRLVTSSTFSDAHSLFVDGDRGHSCAGGEQGAPNTLKSGFFHPHRVTRSISTRVVRSIACFALETDNDLVWAALYRSGRAEMVAIAREEAHIQVDRCRQENFSVVGATSSRAVGPGPRMEIPRVPEFRRESARPG